MTGEMNFINQDGIDANGDEWPLHAAIAKALGGIIKPFDVYQGPYVVFGSDVRIGCTPYALAPTGMGIKRLWLINEYDFLYWYREDTKTESGRFLFDDAGVIEEIAIEEAKQLLTD